jgi:parallel beta-helix repeat protein
VPKTVTRDFGFGTAPGTVSINGVTIAAANIASWTNDAITITVPAGATTGTLLVARSNGNVAPRGVTVHIGGTAPTVVRAGQSIQAAVNAAAEGNLITVEPGVYEETVIVDRRVRLQGYGAGGTLINAVTQPAEKLRAWRVAMCDKVMGVAATPGGGSGANFLLPGQLLPTTYQACLDGDAADNAPLLFGDAEAPGFFVMLKSDGATSPQPRASSAALQIDGFTISGADQGGGVIANGFASGLEVSNNLITGNQGLMAGGIRLGHPSLTSQELPVGSRNVNVAIHHNEIVQNGDTAGATGGGGGGIGLYFGATNYNVTKNYVCGNFSTGNGGGLAHLGVSNGGVIHDNKFLWNASFNQGSSVQGGAISIAGQASLAAANGLSTGSGNVRISSNTIQGNLAGAGDGGGISLLGTNGNELISFDTNPPAAATAAAYLVSVVNNVIVNNVAGVAGGGIALKDAPNTQIINNTISRNDNVSTAARAFPAGVVLQNNTANTALTSSLPQHGAGIASYPHSPVLAARLVAINAPTSISRVFSSPVPLDNNIVYQNRVFHWNQTAATPGLQFDGFSDLEVLDAALPLLAAPSPASNGNAPGTFVPQTGQARLNPENSVLTNRTGYLSTGAQQNVTGVESIAQYWNANTYNGGRDSVLLQLEASVQATAQSPAVAAAFDEGGNFIDVRFGPLTQRCPVGSTTCTAGVPYFDYRIRNVAAQSQAMTIGRNRTTSGNPIDVFLVTDRNGAARPATGNWDAGAYHRSAATPVSY